MSNEDQREWANSVIKSMKGAARAKPNPKILANIKSEISSAQIKQMSPLHRVITIAAAVALLIININALKEISTQKSNAKDDIELYSYALISDYKI